MTNDEWDDITAEISAYITIDDLVDKSDRTLLIGMSKSRPNMVQHTYIKDGSIEVVRYILNYDCEHNYELHELLGSVNKYNTYGLNERHVDYMHLFLQHCDYEYMKLLWDRVDSYLIDGEFNDYNFTNGVYKGYIA